MNKEALVEQFIGNLEAELSTALSAARSAYATATDSEHHAEHKYDTFSLETSYLARGQAMRVEELGAAIAGLRGMTLKGFAEAVPVDVSALVEVLVDGRERRSLLLTPVAGGQTVVTGDGEVMTMTPASPLGQKLMGCVVGDSFVLELGVDRQDFKVTAVR